MGLEQILLRYLQNPDIEFLFFVIMIAFSIGIFGLSYWFFVIKKGDNKWIELQSTDKFFISLMVGVLSLFISLMAFLAYELSLNFLEKLININFKHLDDVTIKRTILVVIAFFYPFTLAKEIKSGTTSFNFFPKIFKASLRRSSTF